MHLSVNVRPFASSKVVAPSALAFFLNVNDTVPVTGPLAVGVLASAAIAAIAAATIATASAAPMIFLINPAFLLPAYVAVILLP